MKDLIKLDDSNKSSVEVVDKKKTKIFHNENVYICLHCINGKVEDFYREWKMPFIELVIPFEIMKRDSILCHKCEWQINDYISLKESDDLLKDKKIDRAEKFVSNYLGVYYEKKNKFYNEFYGVVEVHSWAKATICLEECLWKNWSEETKSWRDFNNIEYQKYLFELRNLEEQLYYSKKGIKGIFSNSKEKEILKQIEIVNKKMSSKFSINLILEREEWKTQRSKQSSLNLWEGNLENDVLDSKYQVMEEIIN